MITFARTAKRSLTILLGALLAVSMISGTCAAAQQKSPVKSEALRQVLRQYTTGALADYVAVRTDKLVSFQRSLLASPEISRFKTEESKRMAMGMLAADGFFCMAFGKNAEAAQYYEAFHRLAQELPLRDLADIDMRPTAAMEAFFKDPAGRSDADLDKVAKELDQKMLANFDKLASTHEGIDYAIDLFYGSEIEAIYLVAQMVIQSDGKSAGAIAALAAEEPNIVFVQKLIAAIEGDPIQKKISEVPEKKPMLTAVMKTLKRKDGKLGRAEAASILKLVSTERKKIANGTIVGKTAK